MLAHSLDNLADALSALGQRQAVPLVAGDKAGSWSRWYRDAIKLAEDRYDRYLATPPEEIQ